MLDEATPPPQSELDDTDKLTVAEETARLAVTLSAELLWDGEHAYVVALENGHVRTLAVESKAFKRWVITKAAEAGTRVPSNAQQWATARDRLEAAAEATGTRATPAVRVAGKGGVVYLDLGDDGWHCVRVTAAGWTVQPHPADGPYFYRPPRMAALPMPDPDEVAELGELLAYLNAVDEAEKMLLPAWLVQSIWPRGPYPILAVHGPHGSTKTTRVSVAKALTDPTLSSEEIPAVTSPRKPPRDERSIIAAARNNRIVAFDNVSYLDPWLSDALCRLATGAELGDRGLYTDFDEAVFAASRPVLLNGIPDVIGQSDLADRCVQSAATKPVQRKPEVAFWGEFRNDWPRLLGTVLNLLSAALRHWETGGQRVTEDVRMSNFARIGEALGVELGWAAGSFTAVYAANLRDAATRISQDDPIFVPLLRVLDAAGGSWTGTMGELRLALKAALDLGEVDQITRGKDWPQTPKALGNKLTRLAPALEHDGIVVGEAVRSNGRTVRTLTREVHFASALAEGPS